MLVNQLIISLQGFMEDSMKQLIINKVVVLSRQCKIYETNH